MKSVVVLGLVAAAVAVLFFVLFGDPAPGPGAAVLLPGERESLPEATGRSTDIQLAPDRAAVSDAASRAERQAVQGAAGSELAGAWANGLEGTVLSPSRQPLEGVRITLERHKFANQLKVVEAVMASQTGEQPEAWTTSSDAEGRFRFSNLPPSSDYTVKGILAGFSPTERGNIVVTSDSVATATLVMSVGYQLRGRVMDDSSGAPVAGAKLVLQSLFAMLPGAARGGDDIVTFSEPDGTYRFENVPPGTLNLTVTAEGYGSVTRSNLLFAGDPKDPQNVDFRLSLGLCMRGRVVAPDRTPIPGARIEVTSYETAQTSRGTGVSNNDGYFEVCDLADGTFMVIVRAKNFSDQRLTRVKLSDPDIQVVMARQGGVMGEVVSKSNGSIVSEFRATVRAVAPGSTTYGRAVVSSKFKNPEGKFELGGLEAGSYVMQVDAPGFAPTYSDSFIVSQGIVTADVRVELIQGGKISGRIVDAVSGQPVAGALVKTLDNGYVDNPFTAILGGLVPRTSTDRKVRTDKDGAFSIEQVTPTTYQLQIDHEDYTRKTIKDLVVLDAQTRDLGSVRLPKGATIRGTVYGPSGAPLPGARISLIGQGISFPGLERSDAEGRFHLKNVRAGTWQLSAVKSDSENQGNPFGAIIDMKKSEITVTVADGQDLVRNLTIGN